EKRKIFKSPKTTKEHFSNTLRLTDEYLKTFFYELNKREYLKDSIVIITGDHSYPMSEHGNYRSEVGHFEESFRIPFLFIWNNKDKKINTKLTYSQLDIAPTLLNLLNIKTNNHFVGKTMINQNESQHQIYLIQPYDGHHLLVLDYPLKYVKHLRSNREYIYDLKNDPLEKDNIISKYKNTSTLRSFHEGLGKIIFNQKLIQENRIWSDNYFSFNRK
ncbi:MAG: sulfatase-like hydrolase/transferase, partial [Bdellovibrionales bacterium]|nr:sulfatase-like hydrolase/transferase [Bdellovibrionales bacterium]